MVTGGGGGTSPKPTESKSEYLKDPLYGGDGSRNVKEHTMDAIIDVLSDYRSQELYGRKVDKNEIRSVRLAKLKEYMGPEKASKLITQLELFKQDDRFRNLGFEEKLNAFVDTMYRDKDTAEVVRELTAKTGYGIVDHWRGSSVLNPERRANHFAKDGGKFGEGEVMRAIENSNMFRYMSKLANK